MDMGDLKSLVFFLIAFLAWVIQAAAKHRQDKAKKAATQEARQARAQKGGAPTASPARPVAKEPDVVYGRKALPPRYESGSARAVSAPPPPLPPVVRPHAVTTPQNAPQSAPPGALQTAPRRSTGDRPTPKTERARTSSQPEALAELKLGTLRGHVMESNFVTTEAATVRQDRSGRNARRHLGIDKLGGTREALRVAILWREILGPPLSRRGPRNGFARCAPQRAQS